MPTPKHRLARVLHSQARQATTRSGLVFVALTAAGVTLTEEEATLVMAVAGLVAAACNFILQDRSAPDE
jgi:hypothetical protein